jgi:ring-1,2-phenylacetyl-CoA epoxidase subunit PaaD
MEVKEKTHIVDSVWKLLDKVMDPEIPVLAIVDLGIVREVKFDAGQLTVVFTPTYSGCPATEVIREMVRTALTENGFEKAVVKNQLDPPWTTEWISERGKQRLKEYGIAPPEKDSPDKDTIWGKARVVPCPRCESDNTEMISQFGSTPCKAHYRCLECLEPFDYFKCL